MIRATVVLLGIGAVVAGLAPIAQAQSVMPYRSDNNSVTLSGDSLRRIESRTMADDYRTFFNGTSQVVQRNSGSNVGRITQSPQGSTISNQVDVVVGDTLNPQYNPTSFPPSGEVGDRERVRVQLKLGQ